MFCPTCGNALRMKEAESVGTLTAYDARCTARPSRHDWDVSVDNDQIVEIKFVESWPSEGGGGSGGRSGRRTRGARRSDKPT